LKANVGQIAGYVMSGLVVAFMLFDGIIKLVPMDVVIKTQAELGYPTSPGMARFLGMIGLTSTLLYAFPRTSLLGAILMTGYLGGAITTHLRVGNPLFTHILFGAYIGLIAWGGLYLRDPQLRALLPLRLQ
jgi:hypothetical protein